jgi:hypothetical protein
MPNGKRPINSSVRLGSIPHAIRERRQHEQRHGNPSGTRDCGKNRNRQGNSQRNCFSHISHYGSLAREPISSSTLGTLGPLGMPHLKNNEAPAIDRGCVADASHVS